MTLFLSGPMGAGKSTLLGALGARLGGEGIDLDRAIEAREGASIAAIFRARGESAFRSVEREVLAEVLAKEPVAVALGGGTVTDRATRHALLARGTLITLTAPADVLAARVGSGETRPLLAGAEPAEAVLARLVADRRDAYAEAHDTIDTAHFSLDASVARILAAHARGALLMPLGARSYRIHVGAGLSDRILDELARAPATGATLVVSDTSTRPYGAAVRALAERAGRASAELVLPAGESHKTLGSVEALWDAALEARLDRRALLLAVGGGVVGDLAGFAAATLLRGVAYAQVPTSLLAMVDASVGGKTGFDRPQGKNLVGAFHQPAFVVADLDTLATLARRELASGLAEVVKAAWLTGEADVRALEDDATRLASADTEALARAARAAIRTKIAIVAQDEAETGVRMHLNLGHTLGHAIEAASGYTRAHGECVALGMIGALRIGVALGDARREHVQRVTELLVRLGLPVELDRLLDDALATYLAADKKGEAGRVRFVVPGAPGHTRVQSMPIPEILALARRQ